jgi:hypothetical protein
MRYAFSLGKNARVHGTTPLSGHRRVYVTVRHGCRRRQRKIADKFADKISDATPTATPLVANRHRFLASRPILLTEFPPASHRKTARLA